MAGNTTHLCKLQLQTWPLRVPAGSGRSVCTILKACPKHERSRGVADDKKALNLAIRDQIAALQWVQTNIEAFGGDKHKVLYPFVIFELIANNSFFTLVGDGVWRKCWCNHDLDLVL